MLYNHQDLVSPTWGFKSLHLHHTKNIGKRLLAFSLFCYIRFRLRRQPRAQKYRKITVQSALYGFRISEYSTECNGRGQRFTHNTGVSFKSRQRQLSACLLPQQNKLYTRSALPSLILQSSTVSLLTVSNRRPITAHYQVN